MLVLKSNSLMTGTTTLNGRTLNADAIFAAYEAAVVAAGGTVYDDTAARGLIEDLIEAGVYNAVGIAITAAGGAKNLGAASAKLYSVGPGFEANNFNNNGEFVYHDTTSFAYPTYRLANSASAIGWTGFKPRKANAFTVIAQSPLPNPQAQGVGLGIYLDQGPVDWFMETGQNNFSVTSTPAFPYLAQSGRTGPQYQPNIPYLATWHWDFEAEQLFISPDAIDTAEKARVFSNIPQIAVDETVPTTITTSSAVNVRFAELIMLNGYHTLEQVKALVALRRARY